MSMPLAFAKENKVYIINRIKLDEKESRHLSNLGFAKGETIKVLSIMNSRAIVLIKGARLAIDKTITEKIYVEELEQNLNK